MNLRRTLTGALAAPLLLLPACGGGDPSGADRPIASAPPTSPSPTKPPKQESPEHFIRRWAAEDTRIQKTGDTSRFREMSKGCRGCLKLANLVDRIYSAGGFITTEGWRITRISASDSGSYDLFVNAAATTFAEKEGGQVHHLPSGPAHFQLRLKRNGSTWNVTYLVQIAA
ncbi:MAG: hypothetical protein J2P22_02410 [Nocardioides sp.]|nr:hypothetical protein [Nocardioides sp.]